MGGGRTNPNRQITYVQHAHPVNTTNFHIRPSLVGLINNPTTFLESKLAVDRVTQPLYRSPLMMISHPSLETYKTATLGSDELPLQIINLKFFFANIKHQNPWFFKTIPSINHRKTEA